MDQHAVVSTIAEFMKSQHVNFQREAVGSLCELVHVDSCRSIIRQYIPAMSSLLHSPNESVATYAAFVIYKCDDADQNTEKSHMIESALFTVREEEQSRNDEPHNY